MMKESIASLVRVQASATFAESWTDTKEEELSRRPCSCWPL